MTSDNLEAGFSLENLNWKAKKKICVVQLNQPTLTWESASNLYPQHIFLTGNKKNINMATYSY